ncbi:MAG: hypothetical protein AAGG68_23540 [Bacteroidota bacterium]
MNTNTDNIILHNVTPEQHKAMMQKMIREEIERMFLELQTIMGDDDLISTGRAASLLGLCNKSFRLLANTEHFTVYQHLKERRFSRGEILEYRNQYKSKKRRSLY